MPGKISIVICCYNEYTNLPTVINAIHENIKPTGYQYEIIAVNDGSVDGSQELLEELSQNDENLFYIEFSRNFGHQNALKAGIDHASGDCVISMDADMQHPPPVYCLSLYKSGKKVRYCIYPQECDPSLGLFKRISSKYFYKFLNAVSDIKMEKGAADFRLMDRHAADVLVNIKGGDLFIRGW